MSALTPLLATKLRIPPIVSTVIPRPHLLEKLNEGLRLGRRATLVSAPAGYGKTTLLSYWAHHCQRAVAWLSLDEEDGDPARFLAYLVAALRRANVIVRDDTAAVFESPQPSAHAILATLINEVETAPGELALVLDDYHLIAAQPVHDALTFLLDHLPSPMHLVIATRADPPLPLALRRARGELLELRQDDLCFMPDETTAFLNEAMRLGLKADDIAALAARTEGWIAGLQMAAASLQGHEDAPAFIRAFTGSNRHILDYLVEQVLQRQTQQAQTFLIQTSILDRLTGSLCEALTGQNNGQATLEWLERANLFIVPLDDERKWYRYHRLFADLLQKRLGETYPELTPVLHLRASRWHEQNGLMAEAIDHALAAKDFERAAQLIEQVAEIMLGRSESAALLKWINALPEAHVRARPLLCVYHAWVLLLGGSPLEAVEAPLTHLEENGPASSKALPVKAFVAYYRGDPARAAALSQRALEQLPENDSFFGGLAQMALAVAYHIAGDTESSQRFMQEAGRAGSTQGNAMITVNAVCYRADLLRREGKLHQAHSLFQQALDLATGPHGARLPVASRALIGLGEIAREWNHLEDAARYVHEGIELSQRWAAGGGLSAYLMLARIRQAQKDWAGVREMLQKMRQLAVEFKASDVDDRLVDAAEAWMQIAQGDLNNARDWAQRYGLSRDVDPAQFELGGDANTRRLHKYEYPVAARLWLAEGRPAEALALLESALPIVEKMNRIGLVIEYEILAALAAHALDRNENAMPALERALTLAQPEEYVRIFVDEGEGVRLLLARMMSEGRFASLKGYIHKLLAAYGQPSLIPQPLVEPLSDRELEVLRLIAEGLSNEDIAHRLVLSLPTVKWHTSNIYGKLSVKNRTQAVATARALGILPEHG